jgi:hypothetical protein
MKGGAVTMKQPENDAVNGEADDAGENEYRRVEWC